MEELFTFIKEGQVMIEIMLIVVTAIITFLFGRYTSYLDDRRTGMKDINNSFYKLFLSTYKNEHHAYALFFVDLDQCFSGYSKDIENGREISDEEKKYVENGFHHIYNYYERKV